MFSKTSKDSPETASAPPTPPVHQPTPTPAPAPPAPKRMQGRGSGVPSIFSAEVVIRGTIIAAGELQIDGRIEGDVRATSLVVGDKATIIGELYAEEATIRGRVEGGVSARKVQLSSTCHVSANILHESLSVEAGAYFEGNCRHSDNPLAEAPDSLTATASPQARPANEPARKPGTPGGKDDHGRTASFTPLKS